MEDEAFAIRRVILKGGLAAVFNYYMAAAASRAVCGDRSNQIFSQADLLAVTKP